MKILLWCISFLVLVASKQVDSQRISDRECTPEDVETMISGKERKLKVTLDVVKAFVNLQGDANAPVNQRNGAGRNPFEDILRNQGRTSILPAHLRTSGHHIIPWTMIGRELNNIKRNINKEPTTPSKQKQMYENVQKSLNKIISGSPNVANYKKETWHRAIQQLKDNMIRQCTTGNLRPLLSIAIHEVAQELNYMVRWTPNNIYMGPAGGIRWKPHNIRTAKWGEIRGEPGDDIDIEILQTLTNNQQAKFKVDKISMSLPSSLFKYEATKWFTIIDLLAEVDDGPGIKGPVWKEISKSTNPRKPNRPNENVWIVNMDRKVLSKFCYADLLSIAPGKKCQSGRATSYVGIEDGKLTCSEGNTKSFTSLCQ